MAVVASFSKVCVFSENDPSTPRQQYHWVFKSFHFGDRFQNRKNYLILIMTPGKHDKTSELSKHWSPDSTRNEVIMKTTYPVNQ